jgi:hypothetical protein
VEAFLVATATTPPEYVREALSDARGRSQYRRDSLPASCRSRSATDADHVGRARWPHALIKDEGVSNALYGGNKIRR